MNIKQYASPRELAEALLDRSVCKVQVAAVLSDAWGIFSWGWNYIGPNAKGIHAEESAIKRANRKRLVGCTLTVAARRRKSKRIILARPCELKCMLLARKNGIAIIEYTYGLPTPGWEVIT